MAAVPDYSFIPEAPDPPNHGKNWSQEDVQLVRDQYRDGIPITNLMGMFGRTRASIEAKVGPICPKDPFAYNWKPPEYYPGTEPGKTREHFSDEIPKKPNPKSKEQFMNLIIEDKKFINGVAVDSMSLSDFVNVINGANSGIAKLKAITPMPKAIEARIAQLETDLIVVVGICDERFPG